MTVARLYVDLHHKLSRAKIAAINGLAPSFEDAGPLPFEVILPLTSVDAYEQLCRTIGAHIYVAGESKYLLSIPDYDRLVKAVNVADVLGIPPSELPKGREAWNQIRRAYETCDHTAIQNLIARRKAKRTRSKS